MTILSIAYPLFPVSEDSAGGAEQILYLLERGMVRAGHRSIVIAAASSRISGTLIAGPSAGPTISDQDRTQAEQIHRVKIQQTLEEESVDLLHFHGLDFPTYMPATRVPMLATLHLPLAWYANDALEQKQVTLVCVSQSQRATAPPGRNLDVIENGVDLIGAGDSTTPRDTLLWLGRICPEKGTHIALQVSHALDMSLTIAGPVHGFAFHKEYFRERIEPLLDAKRTYVGPVGRETKVRLLRRAKALLIPSLAAETSSLVAMEAISAGTPVVCFASGALPEIVEHGVSGFVVHSEPEMADAIREIRILSPQRCLERSLARFSAERMVSNYLALLASLNQQATPRRRHSTP